MRSEPARPPRRILAALVLPLLAVVAGCGTADADPAGGAAAGPTGGPSFPVTVTAANGQVTLEAVPQKIVSLSPTSTEILFAVGAGSQVVAVDDQSSHPAEAPRTKLSGFQPNAEAVAGYDPDLVVLANDTNGIVKALDTLGVPTLLLPAPSALAGSFEQITTIGTATGHRSQATDLVRRTTQRIDVAVASVPAGVKGMKIYHELDTNYYSPTSATFVGSLYTRFGLENIADRAPDAAGGYPRLSAEYVVDAAPDIIVLSDATSGGQTPAKVAERPAFDTVPAVREGRVIPVDEDIASRWGPRTADYAEAFARALAEVG
jgi:iron complex transport system substrate-binding protein